MLPRRIRATTVWSLAACLAIPALTARAEPSFPHSTVGGGQTFVQFGAEDVPPLPAGFFGPGSEPFEGQVAFEGEPDQADTMVMPTGPVDPTASIPIEIVEMRLTAPTPIEVRYFGGTEIRPWFVELRLSKVKPLVGEIVPTQTHPNGGVFNATIPVLPQFRFRSDIPGDPELILDYGNAGIGPVNIVFQAVPYVISLAPHVGIVAPYDGLFVPGVSQPDFGDPGSQVAVPAVGKSLLAGDIPGGVTHVVEPVPALPTCDLVGCWSLCLSCDPTDPACNTPVGGDLSFLREEMNFLPVHLGLVQASKLDPDAHAAVKAVQEILAKQDPPPKDLVKIANVQDAINAIDADFAAQGPTDVVIFGHGAPGQFKVGSDDLGDPAVQDKFIAEVRGKIKTLTLVGCEVARGPVGQAFLKKLTGGLGAPVHAWESKIYVFGHDPVIPAAMQNTFQTEAGTEKKEIPAVTEWGLVVMCLLVLTAGTMVVLRRRPEAA